MLDQIIFDRSEDIADALHDQEGLERALIGYLDGKLAAEDEHVVIALIHGQRDCRTRATSIANAIARSEATGEVP